MSDCKGISCCDPTFSVSAPNPPPPPIVYLNTRQCATASCPIGLVGNSVTRCKEAGIYPSTVNQIDADNQAFAAALAEAEAALACGLAGALDGMSWQLPSTNGAANPCTCADSVTQTNTAQGAAGVTYTVQLRIRGVVELAPYVTFAGLGGWAGGTANQWVFSCTTNNQTVPVPHGGDGANQYALIISDPPAVYLLNNSPGNVDPTAVTSFDYQLNIRVKTGATVTIAAYSIDGIEWNNVANLIVDDSDLAIPFPQPFGGQFIVMKVLSIV